MDNRQQNGAEANRLVGAYSDLILRLSYTYLRSTHDAEDICQTVLIKLLRNTHTFESPDHEKAWVIRTTSNACKDVLRSSFRRTTVNLDVAQETAAPEIPESEVLDAVMELPQKYREAIYLHYFEGYSIREIAALTDRSESAVSAHLSRGRAKLRGTLEGAYCGQGV